MSQLYTDEIVKLEFELFDQVNNVGGRASCQDDFTTFEIMRAAQFDAWNDEMRASYLNDLRSTTEAGRNLVLEKYAYMSGYSYMGEEDSYELKQRYIDIIMSMMMKKTEEMRRKYPKLTGKARPMSTDAGEGMYPLDNYLFCELYTYSAATLKLFKEYLVDLEAVGKSLPIMIMENTVKRYGFKDMEEAEARTKA